MPIEKRDSSSGAKLFIPTDTERSIRAKQAKLSKEIKEVESLKDELKSIIKELKENE